MEFPTAELPFLKYGRKKMSVYNFNFTPLLDEHVIIYERPLRGYRMYSEAPPLVMKMKPKGKTPQTSQRQSIQLPEQAKIDAILKGKDPVTDTDQHRFFFEPLQLLRKDKDMQADASEKDTQTTMAATTPGKRELATMHTVCAPKTGAIKLTGLAYELDYPLVYDDRKKVILEEKQNRDRRNTT